MCMNVFLIDALEEIRFSPPREGHYSLIDDLSTMFIGYFSCSLTDARENLHRYLFLVFTTYDNSVLINVKITF